MDEVSQELDSHVMREAENNLNLLLLRSRDQRSRGKEPTLLIAFLSRVNRGFHNGIMS